MDGLGKAEEKRHRRRIWLLVLAPIAAIIVVAGAVAGIWFATGRAELNEAVADLEAAGIPTKISEIIPPPVPDAENAALVYQQAWAQLGELPDEIRDIARSLSMLRPDRWPNRERLKLAEYLDGKRPGLRLAKRAASLKGCRFSVDYSVFREIPPPHLVHMRDLTRLAAIDAIDKLGRSDFEAAIDSCMVGRVMGSHCGQAPFAIEKLVELSCFAISDSALLPTLSYGDPTLAQLQELLKRLEAHRPDTDLKTAFAAQMCVLRDFYDRVRTGRHLAVPESLGEGAPALGRWLLKWVADRDESACIAAVLAYDRIADEPYFRAKADVHALEAELQRARWVCPLTKITTPVFDAALMAASRAEARYHLERLAVALMIYEKEHGVFPDALGALAPDIIPEVPVDPFSGKAYVYRREASGFVVYSLDRNMKDDNGVSSRDVGKDKGDIVFILGHRQ